MDLENIGLKDLKMAEIPFVAHEAMQNRYDKIIKRLIAALIIITALLFATNIIWIKAWTAYDYLGEYEQITVDSEDAGNANYIGNDGSIINGEGDG